MSFNTVYSSIIDYKCHVNNDISIMTFNIQSLNSKFNELKELVYTLNCNNCEPDIICLQELWQFPMEAEFLLPGYKPLIYKLRRGNTQGGGVGIYVKKDIDYSINSTLSIFFDRVFESLAIEITLKNSNQKLKIITIYRPNSGHNNLTPTEQFNQSMELLSNMLENIGDSPSILCGDLNIDVLKYNFCNSTNESFIC